MTGNASSAPTRPESARLLVAFGVLALVTAYLFQPLVTDSQRFFEWDVAEEYWPDLVYLCDALHDGELPTWNPYDRAGYPYYADPQAGMYHPINWMICGVAGARPGLGWATFRVVLGFALAGVFSLLWLRKVGTSTEAALLGAVAFECAPFMRHNLELNLTAALAWLPLMLLGAEYTIQHRRVRDGAFLALAIALCAWTGSPPALWLSCTFLALYIAVRSTTLLRGLGKGAALALGRTLLVALVLVVALVAVVFVPGLTLAKFSVQAGRSFESISAESLRLRDLAALVWPREGNHLYAGIFSLLSLLVVVRDVIAARTRRILAAFAITMWLLAVVLSLGASTPVFRAAFDWVPGVRVFRLPYRYEAWIGPATGLLLALAFDRVLAEASKLARFAVPLAAALAVVFVLDTTRTMSAERHTASAPAPFDTSVAHSVARVAAPLLRDHASRMMDEFGVSCRFGTRERLRDFRGYQDPLMLSRYERIVDRLHEAPNLMPQFNVRYVLTAPHFLHGWGHHYAPPPDQLRAQARTRDRGNGILEFENALPFAYFVGEEHVRRVESGAALDWLAARAPARVLALEASGAAMSSMTEESRVADATALHVERSALSFDIDAPARGYVVVNEAYYPGWDALVDGHPVRIEQGNVLVRALAVNAGRHHVAMRFAPSDAAWTRLLLLAGWIALVLCFSLARRPRLERAFSR